MRLRLEGGKQVKARRVAESTAWEGMVADDMKPKPVHCQCIFLCLVAWRR